MPPLKLVMCLGGGVTLIVLLHKRRNAPKLLRYFTWVECVQTCVGLISAGLYSITTLELTRHVHQALNPSLHLPDQLPMLSQQFLRLALQSEVYNFLYLSAVKTAGNRLVFRLRRDVFRYLLDQPPAFYDTQQTGALATQLMSDTEHLATLPQCIARAVQHLVFVGRGLYFLYDSAEDPRLGRLALELVVLLTASVGLVAFTRRYRRKQLASVGSAAVHTTGFAEQRLSCMQTIQSFGQEPLELRRFTDSIGALLAATNHSGLCDALQTCMTQIMGYLGIARIVFVCGALCSDGVLTVGGLLAFTTRSILLMVGVRGGIDVLRKLTKMVAHCEPLLDWVHTPHTQWAPAPPLTGSVELRDVVFRYPSRPETLVLDHVSFTIKAGSCVGVVGSNGAGKTTLAMLLLNFYAPASGQVLVGGVDIQTVDPSHLRQHIAYVPQEPILFDGTLHENIAYGSPTPVDRLAVEKAARRANAHEFITALPEGYETQVTMMTLSGGQKQRVAIARALMRDPVLLILDEATGALDSENEQHVQSTISTLAADTLHPMTILIVGHRLGGLLNAQHAIVLGEGRVLEEGPAAGLMSDSTHFRQIVGVDVDEP
eukprot:NODE_685_length_1951_cov_24.320175_g636_i0.p1 GENE.NODE_685_length_1951_cov_24.320175_g636_i0~~NODE_685_length_1951_cov_24.320175_g636_i0.p1  ORF type:complete len:617 (-),score=142.31 NODE_685_length_1951_cov_24.320175_g636_i0:101-1900(-)